MINKLRSLTIAASIASAVVFAGAWALTAYSQPMQPKQNAGKAPSLASQLILSFPDYNTASPEDVEKATNDFNHQRTQIIRLLLFQLSESPLPNQSKTEVIRLLGELHAREAIGELIKDINYFDEGPQRAPLMAARRRGGYIARNALSEIGSPAAQAILTIIGTKAEADEGAKANSIPRDYGFEPSKVDGFAEVLIGVQGDDSFAARVALFQLQQRQSEAQDLAVKAQFDAVIARVKVRLAQMQNTP